MEVSASEAEERGFASGTVSLDRVTKEQLYAAYRRTQERYKKYRTQYGDLARHYKLLERENAKARSVLVETQDKALRRISELKEQCSLEQSAKAHLEKALRIDIEEKNMTIDALNTKVKVLQNNIDVSDNRNATENLNKETVQKENDVQLINLANDNATKSSSEESCTMEITNLNNKIEKMEQLINKYKESLKSSKEKNSQVVTELQILSNELENKNKEIDQFKITAQQLDDAFQKIQDLNNVNEDLQNKINTYDFTKTKEMSELEMDLQRAKEEITHLQGKIEVFSKREEEYAISLAENKLSIHKELENKEAEIKSLKDSLASSQKEVQSLNIVINDCKANIVSLEEERSKLINENKEYKSTKSKVVDLDSQLQDLNKKCQLQEQMKTKADEEYKCLQLQFKQETAEKLAMIDRNAYLENKNTHLSEENSKKCSQISMLENELQMHKNTNINVNNDIEKEKQEMSKDLEMWKSKYDKLELEIQEEREELVKLQSEIEKLLAIHELTQKQNIEFKEAISDLKTVNALLQDQISNNDRLKARFKNVASVVSELNHHVNLVSNEAVSFKKNFTGTILDIEKDIKETLVNFCNKELELINNQYETLKTDYNALQQELTTLFEHNSDTSKIITSLRDENNNMKSKILNLELEKDSINESKIKVDNLYEAALNNIEALKHEQKELVCKIQENANKSKNLEAALDLEKTNSLTIGEKLAMFQNENKDLRSKLNKVEEKNRYLTEEIENTKHELSINMDKLSIMTKENRELKEKSDEVDSKIICINNLQDNITVISEENISLKNQIENIAGNIKGLEAEIIEVRKSHADMEIEKDRLSSIIEKLESEEKKSFYDSGVKYTQTGEIIETNEIIHEVATPVLSNSNISAENEVNDNISTNNEYLRLKNDNEALKDENRRLQSDVEGLQKYLTKISKENSVLNDKLRELIATSEHSSENNDYSNDITELKNEVQINKDKIESLLRENSLLIEENYELKDQLQSQNYTAIENKNINNNDNDRELSNTKEKYKDLVQSNTKTEQKLGDLEQLNRSLNSNIQQMQDKNEKLKMTNEKLERKLDEALVSLRHLHSLQENTELEYLRNILYEYLTGSGMHSITLAKVLSAIVKFDDSQTQLVLQKEKERQGFLRQLGLI